MEGWGVGGVPGAWERGAESDAGMEGRSGGEVKWVALRLETQKTEKCL